MTQQQSFYIVIYRHTVLQCFLLSFFCGMFVLNLNKYPQKKNDDTADTNNKQNTLNSIHNY